MRHNFVTPGSRGRIFSSSFTWECPLCIVDVSNAKGFLHSLRTELVIRGTFNRGCVANRPNHWYATFLT